MWQGILALRFDSLTMQDIVYNSETLKNGNFLPVVECFYTIQGEGRHTGEATYFIRLAGCDIHCPWCDAKNTWNATKFPVVPIGEIVAGVLNAAAPAVVITGGEPLKYPLGPLTKLLKENRIRIYVETSGSEPLSGRIDWICISPKRRAAPLKENLKVANELKVVVSLHCDFSWAEENAAMVGNDCLLYLQPEWGRMGEIMPLIVNYVKEHPQWRVSLQTHKFMDIP